MPTPTTAEKRFEQRVTARALADTLAALLPRRTISPQSLAEAGIAPSLVDAVPRLALVEDGAHMATANLPRIELARRTAQHNEVQQSISVADLEVIGTLGEGGMGCVLLARQHSLARDVAIKTLKDADDTASSIRGLLQEARITGALEHPGIVPVHALGLDDSGLPLLVMKRIEGVSFRALLDDPAHRAWKSVLATVTDRVDTSIEVLMRVCQSLEFAHHRGIVHRDVKPENILVGNYGEVYLCDWGIATRIEDAASAAGMLAGTLVYMAPEMLLGDAVDERTDIYLLGATLHEVLTGKPRHDGASTHEILHSIAMSAPFDYDAAVAPDLARLCNRATSVDRAQRPASAEEFRKELAEYLHRRYAMVLCEAALERMRALEALLAAAPSESVPEDLAGAYRNATEARFGFVQSLRVHPLLDVAKQGLDRTLVNLFDLELRQQHVETAAAVFDEMTDPAPQLVKRLSKAREEAEIRRLENEKLRAIARDLDPSVAARSRMIVVGLVGICGLTIALGIHLSSSHIDMTPTDLVTYAAMMLASNFVVLGIFYRRAVETLFNRRMIAFLFLGVGFMLIHRLIALRTGEKVSEILLYDALMMFTAASIGTATFERRLFVLAVVCGLCTAAMVIQPERTVVYFQLMTLGVLPGTIWVWRTPR